MKNLKRVDAALAALIPNVKARAVVRKCMEDLVRQEKFDPDDYSDEQVLVFCRGCFKGIKDAAIQRCGN